MKSEAQRMQPTMWWQCWQVWVEQTRISNLENRRQSFRRRHSVNWARSQIIRRFLNAECLFSEQDGDKENKREEQEMNLITRERGKIA